MQIKLRLAVMVTALFYSSCVTFNNIDRPIVNDEKEICVDLKMTNLRKNLLNDTLEENELDSLSREKILQVLDTFNISSKCQNNKLNFQVKIQRNISPMYEAFIGGWSVLTVLSAGIIPSYSSFETEVVVMASNGQSLNSNYHYSAAVWLPFIFKQIKDDSYAHTNYNLDARSSVIGIEIAKLIRSLSTTQN